MLFIHITISKIVHIGAGLCSWSRAERRLQRVPCRLHVISRLRLSKDPNRFCNLIPL